MICIKNIEYRRMSGVSHSLHRENSNAGDEPEDGEDE